MTRRSGTGSNAELWRAIGGTLTARLRADREQVGDALRRDYGAAISRVIDGKIGDLSLPHCKAITWAHEIWDRTSPINGVPAETVLAQRTDIPAEGDVILVKSGDRVVMFQPHESDQPGIVPLPTGQGHARGQAMADTTIADCASAEVARRVSAALSGNSGPGE